MRALAMNLRPGIDNANSKELFQGEASVGRYSSAMIEAALFARDCLFFVPTTFCVGIVGMAVVLSAKSLAADDPVKGARLLSDSGSKAAQYHQDAVPAPGFQATALRRLREQRMDECPSGPCLYVLQLASPGRQAQAHVALPQP